MPNFKKLNYTVWIRGDKYLVKKADKDTGVYQLTLRGKKFVLRMGAPSHELEDSCGKIVRVVAVSFSTLNVRSPRYRRDKALNK